MRFTHTNIAARDWESLAQFYICKGGGSYYFRDI